MEHFINIGTLVATTITACVAVLVWSQAQDDRKSASLKAFLQYVDHVNRENNRKEIILVVLNTGRVSAIDIKILINNKPISDWPEFGVEESNKIVIGPGGRYRIPFHEYSESKIQPPFHVHIIWSDESKKKRHWDGTVS